MTIGLTTREAGAILGISHETVRRYCDAGILPCRRLPMSGQRRIERSDVQHLLDQMRQPAAGGHSVIADKETAATPGRAAAASAEASASGRASRG